MNDNLNQRLRRNTVTSYILVFARLLEGILVTRWLYHYLGPESYGFWTLLWAVFVYVLLLDFGFSKAAQKYTAEQLYLQDQTHYNRLISTVFSMQWAMSALILLATAVATYFLPVLTRVTDPGQLHYYRVALLLFGFGTAIAFPTGMFGEILVGLRRIDLRNYVTIAGRFFSVAGILILFQTGGGLHALVIFTILLNLAHNLVMWGMIQRQIPGFRLYFSIQLAHLRELASFSSYTYMIALGNLLIAKTDRLVLSIVTGLADVGIYQLGTRLPEISRNMTVQYQENIAPVSANLRKQNEVGLLRDIILHGCRLSAWLATGACAGLFMTAGPLLRLLFNTTDPLVLEVCQVMLISTYFSVAFRSVPTQLMLMGGRHRLLAGVTVGEAVVNLGLSIWLIFQCGLMGVVYGTLIPNVAIALLVMLPFLHRFLQRSDLRVWGWVYGAPLLCAGLMLLGIFGVRQLGSAEFQTGVFGILTELAAGGVLYLFFSWFVVFSSGERRNFYQKLAKITAGRSK